MATYRQVLDAVIIGTDTTNAAALTLGADPARVATALEQMARAGAIVPVLQGTTHQHRWSLASGVSYQHAREVLEASGIALETLIP